jgi:hypothetical protein
MGYIGRKMQFLRKRLKRKIRVKLYFAIRMKLKAVFSGFSPMNIPWKSIFIHGNIKWANSILNQKNPIGLNKVIILELLNQ